MDPESKKLLEESLKLTTENNDLLRQMRRRQKISFIVRATYWVVIIGTAVGLFYFLDPYISGFQNTLKNWSDGRIDNPIMP